jgi:hypothetical protein
MRLIVKATKRGSLLSVMVVIIMILGGWKLWVEDFQTSGPSSKSSWPYSNGRVYWQGKSNLVGALKHIGSKQSRCASKELLEETFGCIGKHSDHACGGHNANGPPRRATLITTGHQQQRYDPRDVDEEKMIYRLLFLGSDCVLR